MTQPDTTQGPADTGSDVTQDNSTEVAAPETPVDTNPIYQEYVDRFPSSLHSVATEVFKEWDGNTTKRFQDLHSTYEPYKQFVDAWEPDAIGQAIALAQALESNPEEFYKALATSYGFASEQGVENQQQEEDTPPPAYGEDNPYATQMQQQEELLRTLADHVLGKENAEREATQAAENESLLNQALTSLKQTHGEFDENFVLNAVANGADPEQAVMQFKSMVNQWASKQNAPVSQAPSIMGGGNGGLPSQQVDPSTLSNKDTKNLVEQYLKSAQGQ